MCGPCQSTIHSTLTNKELENEYNTIDLLRSHPKIENWIKWRKKHPNSSPKVKWTKERHKKGTKYS